MIIRRRILKIIIVVFIFLSLFSTWYINKFLAPTSLKNFFIKNISQAIDRPVFVKDVHFNLIRGFTLNGLTIYEADGKTAFIKIGRLSTTLLFIPLLKEKKIVIPSVYIGSPSITIVKNQDSTWNFFNPPLFKKEPPSEKPKKRGFSILVQKIRLDNGEINFLDNTKNPSYTKQLINLDGEITFAAIEGAVNFKTISRLNSPLKTNVGLDGSYFLKEDLLVIKTVIKNLALYEPFNYFDKADFPLILKEGAADVSIDLSINKERKLVLVLSSLVKNLDMSVFGLNLKGDIGINGAVDSKPSEPPQLSYKFDLDLKGPTLSGVYLLNELAGLNGKIEISNDAIRSAGLEGYAYNTLIKFNGGIDLKNLELRLSSQVDYLDLINYKNFLPKDLKERSKDMNLTGSAEVNIKFFDRLKDPQPVDIDGKVKLKTVTFSAPAFPNKFENILGEIVFKNNVIYISRTSFDYAAENYILDSKITNLELPDVKMKLRNKELSLNSRFQALKDSIHVLWLAGNYMNSSFNIAGDIQKLDNPNILMRGNVALDLMDLRKTSPAVAEPLTRFDIKGVCNLDMALNGPWKEPTALEAAIKGQSDCITFWNLKINEVKFNLTMKDKHISIPEFTARPYGGTLSSNMEIDLAQQNPPYAINLAMEEVDLSKLVIDTDLKKKPISGKALCKSSIRGYGKNLETMKGEGFIFIKGGYLWELPLLKGVADLLFMPNLSNIVFDEASCRFAIANRAISTSDLKFHSQNVGLLAEGSIYLDGTLDFLVTTTISENFLKGTSEFERLAGALLAEAGQFIGRIKIGGTIKKPEYKFIPFPLDQILKDKLKGLLGGFF